ncbi:MAG: poly-gamma-glutamate system protein [candidate division WOR-3 bacterium]
MRRRHGKVNRWVLVGLAVLALVLFTFEHSSARYRRTRFYEEKLAAARLSKAAFKAVFRMRERLGIPIDTVNDPNKTGLVGAQYSELTYGRSDLSDALTTLNPNFAAAVLELLVQTGVRRGDQVGISWDGTYPALNIELLAVCRCMELKPVIVTSQSAGMWGANWPGMTWLDIERVLNEAGLFDYRTEFATLGGEADDGRGLSPEGRAMLAAAAESAQVELVVPADPELTVQRRLEAFRNARAIVSVGRVVADIGDPLAQVPSRVLRKPTAKMGSQGTIASLLKQRKPVAYLGNPTRVALAYGLPVAPVPIPEVGKGRLFFQRQYSVGLAAIFVIALALMLWFTVRYDIESYISRNPAPEEEAV